MREKIAAGEFYHVYNRGVDKRTIFKGKYDLVRFYESMREFNRVEPIGSLWENQFSLSNPIAKSEERLVNIVNYGINPNHFHFTLEALVDNGISEFMRRLSTGYTQYFNNKYHRSGALFQGKYKYIHIDSDAYLRHLSVYVNRNYEAHSLGNWIAKWGIEKSSYGQYLGEDHGLCFLKPQNRRVILDQFESVRAYKEYADETILEIRRNKEEYGDML